MRSSRPAFCFCRIGRAKRNPSPSQAGIDGFRAAKPILRFDSTGGTMLTGSCLCGSVAYEVDADPGPIVHCHCRTCRKTHGSAFSTATNVPRDRFRWISGEDLLRVLNPRRARHGISAPNAARILSPRARARTPSCFGWAVSIRRLPNAPKCTSGGQIALRGSTRKTSCRSGRKARRHRRSAAKVIAKL